ncbi:MAG: DNA polymerase I [Candidatus Sungbacteria bacterium RIFCSPHIGHO2_01_FULL_54_26]|nr:MAG: DNA polymerase I [Candidatus Sungbacteria bacterium RIFCSPHIGHO2_01_FULL_54_26]
MKKLILIDSHAIIHRAYHALPLLTGPGGEPLHAVYGFTSILMRILKELKPDYIAAAFDLPGPTFRHVAYERYKAQRPGTPNDLASQFGRVREVLEAFRISVFLKEGYEADDIVGTIVERMKKEKNIETIIVTGDMDALQLVGPRVKVYAMRKGISDTVIYDAAAVEERYGFPPARVIDYKGMKGDPSDNIAGVKGIGEKTASELIKRFGSIDGIYKALKKKDVKVSTSVAQRLREGEEDARLSRELATIRLDVPITFALEDLAWRGSAGNGEIRELLAKFGFASLIKRLDVPLPVLPDIAQHGTHGTMSPMRHATEQAVTSTVGPCAASLFSETPRIDSSAKWDAFVRAEKDHTIGLVRDGAALYIVGEESGQAHEITLPILRTPAARKFFEGNKNIAAYDAKALIRLFREHGIQLPDVSFDILLAAYLAHLPTRDFSYAGIVSRERGEMIAGVSAGLPYFFTVSRSLEEKLKQGNLRRIFDDIEIPLAPILARMEDRGILLDRAFLRNLGEKTGKEIKGLIKYISTAAGEEFNINSPSQLSRVLFEKLNISAHGLRKTDKGGVTSTRESELVKLRAEHPIIEHLLRYRELSKLKSTYIDVLPELADPATGRVHTTFNQTGAATGRLSSVNPNLQNIPVMSETGREIRKAFIAKGGFSLVSFDYSQIELRVAAHMAEDEKMIAAFRKGMDIHTITAAEIYKASPAAVTPALRRAAKTLNFGVLYGMGPNALAESAGMDKEEAKKFIREYFREFSGIREFIERTKQFARERGYVETLFGRRRYIPEILSSNPRARAEAERMAVNMPIQGTATGDIIKMALIAVDGWIRKEGLEQDIAMLLQVHDELVFEIKKEKLATAHPAIKKIMESAASLSVPLVVDAKAGPNWGEQTAC